MGTPTLRVKEGERTTGHRTETSYRDGPSSRKSGDLVPVGGHFRIPRGPTGTPVSQV